MYRVASIHKEIKQANIVAATLENVKELQRAYELASDSAGSADKEFEAYQNSLQYSLDQLRNSVQTFYTQIMNSDGLKGLVGSLTSAMDGVNSFIDTFGAMPTVISASVTAFTLFNSKARETMGMFTNALPVVGKFNIKLQTLGEQYKKSANDIQTQITKLKEQQASMNATGGSVDGFNSK